MNPETVVDYITTLLSQFGGGPGPAENNLVRFGLAATFWAVLLIFAWNRQRHHDLPRERLLMIGFGLGFLRDTFMFIHLSFRLLTGTEHDALCAVTVPLEHALTLASMVTIGAAFLRYMIEDDRLTTWYLRTGIGTASIGLLATLLWWPRQLTADPSIRFHTTWQALLIHALAAAMLLSAIVILVRYRGWLRNVVVVSLSFFLLAETLVVFNLATQRVHKEIVCPLGNTLYILAIPLFGYVYFREQAQEKQQAETALEAYRNHLEDLVEERTVALTKATKQLEWAAALEERQRIAAEMHDGLAQTLSYLSLRTDLVAEMLKAGQLDGATDAFDHIQTTITRAVSDVRHSISSLQSTPKPPASLQETLTRLVADNRSLDGPVVTLTTDDTTPHFLAPTQQEQLEHIAQEALTNARRHANATEITLQLAVRADDYALTITDDGIGFTVDTIDGLSGEHFGISIMQARAQRMGGRLALWSRPCAGTRVTLTWPREVNGSTNVRVFAPQADTADPEDAATRA